MSQESPESAIDRPGPDIEPAPSPDENGHSEETGTKEDAGSIWVVDARSPSVLRARFYKALLLGVSCIFQLVIAGEVLKLYGPLTFLAFTAGVVVCAAIAAHEMGSLLSAIDLRLGALKQALWDRPEESNEDPSTPQISRA